MKKLLRDIVFGKTYGDIAVSYALGEALTKLCQDINPENVNEKEIDIVLTIDGIEYNHEEFFEHLTENYFNYLSKQVKNVVIEETMDKINDVRNKLNDIESIVDSISSNIDHDISVIKYNYFKKETN